ncbi:MAG TPA: hypothetical protein VGE05_04245 [Novosphingobium sp.]
MTTVDRLLKARTARDEAHTALYQRLGQVQEDMEARSVGGRIADRVSEEARNAFDHALEIADENPGVIAGTIAAVALWIMRNPIMRRLQRLLTDDEEDGDVDEPERKQA